MTVTDHPNDGQPGDDQLADTESDATTTGGKNSVRNRLGRIALYILVALVGLTLGVAVGGHVTKDVGPLTVEVDLAFTGGANTLTVPPLGELAVHPYVGPVGLDVTVIDIDAPAAKKMLKSGAPLSSVQRDIVSDFENAVIVLFIKTLLFSLLFVALLSALIWRRPRAILLPLGITLLLVVGSLGLSAATFDVKKTRHPTFQGTIAQGKGMVGDVQGIKKKYTSYRKSLVKMITNVSRIYNTVNNLPAGDVTGDTVRVLHVSDLHNNPQGIDLVAALVKQFKIGFIIDTGDINDWGSKFEGSIVKKIAALGVPYLYVKGNHDSSNITVKAMTKAPNVTVLNDKIVEMQGLTIGGIGDPRFTPDKSTGDDHASTAKVQSVGKKLQKLINGQGTDVDLAALHDPKSTKPLYGKVPLILAGHTHQRKVSVVGDDKTLLMVEGSTGAAGLRGTETAKVKSLQTSVLYFNKSSKHLIAWDEITQGGLGESDFMIKRHANPLEATES